MKDENELKLPDPQTTLIVTKDKDGKLCLQAEQSSVLGRFPKDDPMSYFVIGAFTLVDAINKGKIPGEGQGNPHWDLIWDNQEAPHVDL